MFKWLFWGESPGWVANMLDWDIIVSDFEFQSYYYIHFWTNTLRKIMNLLSPQLLVKLYYYCSAFLYIKRKKKTLDIKFWVVFVKMWDQLNKN